MKEKQKSSLEVFESAPVGQAVMKNTIPAMIAMLMVLVYNLADTFFIGNGRGCGSFSGCTSDSKLYITWI